MSDWSFSNSCAMPGGQHDEDGPALLELDALQLHHANESLLELRRDIARTLLGGLEFKGRMSLEYGENLAQNL